MRIRTSWHASLRHRGGGRGTAAPAGTSDVRAAEPVPRARPGRRRRRAAVRDRRSRDAASGSRRRSPCRVTTSPSPMRSASARGSTCAWRCGGRTGQQAGPSARSSPSGALQATGAATFRRQHERGPRRSSSGRAVWPSAMAAGRDHHAAASTSASRRPSPSTPARNSGTVALLSIGERSSPRQNVETRVPASVTARCDGQ